MSNHETTRRMKITGKRKITITVDPSYGWAIVRALHLLADHDEKNMPACAAHYEQMAEQLDAYMKTR